MTVQFQTVSKCKFPDQAAVFESENGLLLFLVLHCVIGCSHCPLHIPDVPVQNTLFFVNIKQLKTRVIDILIV